MPLLFLFLLLRLIFWVTTFPNPDEAYYWLWGQHLDWSYYDHPPFHAWVQGLFSRLFGQSRFVLRLPNVLSNALLALTYYRICRYLYGETVWDTARSRGAWRRVNGWLVASPLFFLFLALAWNDHWLVAFSLVAAYQFVRFLDRYRADGRGATWRLYLAAGALALAGLSKYNALFVALGLLATLLSTRQTRSLLRDPRLYGAIAIAALALVPILIWNLQNDWASFRYYVDRSVNTGHFTLRWGSFLAFVGASVGMVSPWLWWRWGRLAQDWQRLTQGRSLYPLAAFWLFVIPTVGLTFLSLISAALYYWNITAYLLLFPLLPHLWRGRPPHGDDRQRAVPLGASLYGLLFAGLLVVHYSILPLSALVSREGDPDSRMLFGWAEVAAAVQSAAASLHSDPVFLTTDYRSASALAFALGNPEVMAISPRIDQFDFWWEQRREQWRGRSVIILSDDWHPLTPLITAQVTDLSSPQTVSVQRWGIWIKDYRVQTAVNLQPP